MKFGLIGEKLSHSFSPMIHLKIYKNLKLPYNYSKIEIRKDDLKNFIKNNELYKGFNVTMPYKKDIMEYLDEISPEAKEIGAINTINYKDGKILGYNTDYYGFKRMLEYNNINVENQKITILGFGGSARAVLKYFLEEKVNEIEIVVRNIEKVNFELNEIKNINKNIKITSFDEFEKNNNIDFDKKKKKIIVNTTPLGMYPNINATPVSEKKIKEYDICIDLIYNPTETLFLRYARLNRKKYINGLFMLVAQGIASEEIWLEKKITDREIENIVLLLEKEMA